jgi:hypothetical protein
VHAGPGAHGIRHELRLYGVRFLGGVRSKVRGAGLPLLRLQRHRPWPAKRELPHLQGKFLVSATFSERRQVQRSHLPTSVGLDRGGPILGLAAAYIIAGSLHGKLIRQQTGWQVLPHLALWSELRGLVGASFSLIEAST